MRGRIISAPAVRSEVKQRTFEEVFSTISGNAVSSRVFVKKALTIAISNIAYLRGMLDDVAFNDRSLSSIDLKILRECDTGCMGAKQLSNWLRGAFDALDKGYMRGLTLSVYMDPEKPDETCESYIFKFGYSSDGNVHLYDHDGVGLMLSGSYEKVQEETLDMLYRSAKYVKLLRPLPSHVYLSMKLTYLDSTPKDYEPPGYGPASPDKDMDKNRTSSVVAGGLHTGFHGLKMRIRSSFILDGDTLLARKAPKTSSTMAQLVQTNPNASERVFRFGKKVEDEKENDITIDTINSSTMEDERENDSDTAINNEELVFNCPCGVVEDDCFSEGVQCSICYIWQHAICFGMVKHVNIPDQHICQNCFDHSVGRRSSDMMMEDMAECDIAERCLWRKAVFNLLHFDTVTPVQFAAGLKVDISVAQSLLNKMREEDMVSDTIKNGFSREINHRRIKEELNAIILPSVPVGEEMIQAEHSNILEEGTADLNISGQVPSLTTNFEDNKADERKSGSQKTNRLSTRKRKKVINLTQDEENEQGRCYSSDDGVKQEKQKKQK